MENSEAPSVVVQATEGKPSCTDTASSASKLSKQKLFLLLKKHGVEGEADFLQNSAIKEEDVIPSLRQEKIGVAEGFFKDLAYELGLQFISDEEIRKKCRASHDCRFVAILPYSFLRGKLILPLQVTKSAAKIAIANPLDRKAMTILECLLGERKVEWYVASVDIVDRSIEKVYNEIHKKQALWDLYYRSPEESAYRTLLPSQKYLLIGIALGTIICFLLNFQVTLILVFSAINILYFSINPIKFYISIRGLQGSKKVAKVSETMLRNVDKHSLPIYTILVPVYHESKVLPQVMKNIYGMDYPKEKLDVKILLEEKDTETLNEARELGLFGGPFKTVSSIPASSYREFLKVFEPIIVPEADIITKPRACNYGLLRAKGEYCVIYDAEDNPDTDQLKKAAIVFHNSDQDLSCLQSRLNFYNTQENLLSRWFSIEYSYWYDYYLEGLDRVGAPIPLGGTSNHFRTKQLQDIGSWDPYNVTEDADLGIRISRKNLKTQMMDCYTYEEAPIKIWSWIRQRSRWYKGHLQTYLVHMRNPKKLLVDMGLKRFLLFQLTFGGGIFMPIINPILWMITLTSIAFPGAFHYISFFPIQQICTFNLVVGNLAYILFYLMACLKKKIHSLIPLSITMPIYWMLISIGAWRGLVQLITKPFYWEKTEHGISKAI